MMGGRMSTSDRLAAFGLELIDIHDRLREELDRLHEDLRTAPAEPRDLRLHCLSFCTALTRHHTGEDATAFPALADRFPDLAPILAKLQQDHAIMDGILTRVTALTESLGPHPEPAELHRVQGELAGLSAIMESHFAFEEREIVTALNALDQPAWPDDPPPFLTYDETP
jgi:hypothetical protein